MSEDLNSYIDSYKMYTNHPFFDNGALNRLIEEYNKYGNIVIGFDFDNTIFDYHNRGGNYTHVISLLQKCKEFGLTLCLYTAEPDKDWLNWKIGYCKHFKIEPDYVNESPLLPGTKKPFFNILLDDRAGLESAYNILNKFINHIDKFCNN